MAPTGSSRKTSRQPNSRPAEPRPASKAELKDFLTRAVALVEPVLAEQGFEVVWAQCPMEGGRPVLRFFVDLSDQELSGKVGSGMGLDDCARASRIIDEVLEADEKPQPEGYVLEISSPGLDRPLWKESDYQRFQGRQVKLKLRQEGRNLVVKGRLMKNESGDLTVETTEGNHNFSFNEVSSGRLSLEGLVF